MTLRHKFLMSSLIALAAVSACQSNTTGDTPPGTGGAGAGGVGASGATQRGGASGQGTGGQPRGGGAGAAHAGTSGEAGGSDAGGSAGLGGSVGNSTGGMVDAGSSGAMSAESGSANGGEAGAAGEAGAGQSPNEFAYASGLFSGVFVCSVDPVNGAPNVHSGSPMGSKHALGIAVDPSQRFVYVGGDDGHIDTYPIAADGSLPAAPSSTLTNAGFIFTIEPKGHFLYAAGSTSVDTYEIDSGTGALSPIGTPLHVGEAPDFEIPTYLAVDPTGNFLYLTHAAPGLRGYRINRTSGELSELAGSPFGVTGQPDAVRTGAIAIKPSGDFLYTAGALLNSGGALNGFKIEAGTGKLSLLDGSPFSLDTDADDYNTNIAMDPQGRYVYVTSAFQRSHLSGFNILTDGTLQEVPGSPLVTSSPYSVAVDPSGRFVYVGSDSGRTSVFSLIRSNGKLNELMTSPFLFGGLQPEIAFAKLH